jgi:hypothetical protein
MQHKVLNYEDVVKSFHMALQMICAKYHLPGETLNDTYVRLEAEGNLDSEFDAVWRLMRFGKIQ